MKQIFPKEIIENSIEVHRFKHTTRSKAIYTILLLLLMGILVSLPFIEVSVYTAARGIVKADRERIALSNINSGRVLFHQLYNNQKVHKGDTLLVLTHTGVDEKITLTEYRLGQSEAFVADLKMLLGHEKITLHDLKTPKYQRDLVRYRQELAAMRVRIKKLKRDFDRNKTLYDKKVIALADFENVKPLV